MLQKNQLLMPFFAALHCFRDAAIKPPPPRGYLLCVLCWRGRPECWSAPQGPIKVCHLHPQIRCNQAYQMKGFLLGMMECPLSCLRLSAYLHARLLCLQVLNPPRLGFNQKTLIKITHPDLKTEFSSVGDEVTFFIFACEAPLPPSPPPAGKKYICLPSLEDERSDLMPLSLPPRFEK